MPSIMQAQEQTTSEKLTGKPGLMLVSHGSPAEIWNNTLIHLFEKVQKINATETMFHAIVNVYMEFAEPDVASGIETLEAAGCDRIIVVPLFVFPASHTHFDLPTILGISSSPAMRAKLEKNGIRVANPTVPVLVTQTLDEGPLLENYVRDEVALLSKNPDEEALLLIQHGDPSHASEIEPKLLKLLVAGCGSKGITRGKWVDCQLGQSYFRNVVPAVKDWAENRKNVLMVGLYLASSAKSVHDAALRRAGEGLTYPYEGIDVCFSKKGIIDHPGMADWVWEAATLPLE